MHKDFCKFMSDNKKCADSFSKWLDSVDFESDVICRVVLDYFMAFCKGNEMPLENTLKLIKDLDKIPRLFFNFSRDDDDDDDDSECSSENIDVDDILVKLTNSMNDLSASIKKLEKDKKK